MSVTIDEPRHYLKLECDGKRTPFYCSVSITSLEPTRDECNQFVYRAGWRLDGKRTLCAACLRREHP